MLKLSFNSGLFNSFASWLPSYLLDEVIIRLSEIGYDAIEIGAASPHAWPQYTDQKRRKEILSLLRERNMEVSSICPSYGGGPGFNPASPIEAERKACIANVKDCIDLAADLESKMVVWLGGWQIFGVQKKQAWEWSRQGLIECGKYAGTKGINLAIEPTPADSNIIETHDDAIIMMKETNLSNVKVMIDTYMIIYRNEVMEDCIPIIGEDLFNVHISDADRLPPGSGGKDFRPFIKSLKQINYDKYLTLDLSGPRGTEPFSYALKAYEYLVPLMKEYGLR